eukprot:GFUD01009404.1.p1 GENE.GFUD01009404.1~~GFUD01009404.1.p1  ORF type:complete len:498 (+),score=100.02 GFUD01009404.1:221-1495(+)
MEQLGSLDGHSEWRKKELEKLTSQVQSAITLLQNPPDCKKAKILVCNNTYIGCGMGCQIHNKANCLITALATNRVLLLSEQGWGYNRDIVLKDFFMPLSSSCTFNQTDFEGNRTAGHQVDPDDTTRMIEILPDWSQLQYVNMGYSPPALPTALAYRIFSLIRDPDAWWVGQMVGYLMRPNERVRQVLSESEANIDFSYPVVGVHVRRGDKRGEGGIEFLPLEVYMEQVELWFTQYEMYHPPTERRIYLASDDPQVLEESHEKYPQYTIYDNHNISSEASKVEAYSEESLIGILHDIHMLSLTDYVVCTLSSGICGLVYELLHFKHGDASGMVHSLDSPWFFVYRHNILLESVVENNALNLRKGDRLEIQNIQHSMQLRNKYKKTDTQTLVETKNLRTEETSHYPVYMVKKVPVLFNFSIFDSIV